MLAKKIRKISFAKLLPLVLVAAFILPFAGTLIAFGDGYENQIVSNGQNQSYEAGKVQISKIATQTAKNEFDIKLSVDTEDEITHYLQSSSADVVLLIDTSYSMISNSNHEDRVSSAKAAAVSFVQKMLGSDGSAGNKIAVATYNTYGHTIKTLSNNAAELTTAINSIAVDTVNINNSYTNMQGGLIEAQNLLATGQNSQQFIVLFSDGVPTRSYQGTSGELSTAIPKVGGGNYDFRITASNSTLKGSSATYNFTPVYNINISGTNKSVSDHGLPTLSQAYLAKHATKPIEIYSVLFMATSDPNYNTGSFVMRNMATDADHYINTSDLDELAEIFQDISIEIIQKTNVWKIADPMGKFIEFVSVTGQTAASDLNAGITVPSNDNDYTLTWNLLASGVTPEVLSANHYRYTLTYHIRLRPDWSYIEGANTVVFDENQAYATNGTTTLKYFIGDTFNAADVKSVDFIVPTVNGTLPMINYTIEHAYYTSTDGGAYEPDGVYTDPTTYSAKLWSSIDTTTINAIGQIPTYDENLYTYKSTTPSSLSFTNVNGIYKITLRYEREVTLPKYSEVTVNHHYTEYDEFGSTLSTSDYQVNDAHQKVGTPYTADLRENGYTFNAVDSDDRTLTVAEDSASNIIDLYYTKTTQTKTTVMINHIYTAYDEDNNVVAGESFTDTDTATNQSIGDPYTANAVEKNGFTLVSGEPTSKTISSLAASGNEITFHYSKSVQTKTSVTVEHIYTVYDENDQAVAYQSFTDSFVEDDLLIGNPYAANAVEKNGFTLVSGEPTSKTISSLAASGNEITFHYSKHIQTQNSVTVQHIYITYDEDGEKERFTNSNNTNVNVTYEQDETTGEWVPVYGSYTADPILEPNLDGIIYDLDSVSPSATIDLTSNPAENVITFIYERTIQTKTTVTVKHIYTAYDEDDNVVASESSTNSITTSNLLIGDPYTATAIEINGFTLVPGEPHSQTIDPLLASGNEITFHYSKHVQTKADVTIHHIYTTYDEYGAQIAQEIATDIVTGQTIGDLYTAQANEKGSFTFISVTPSDTITVDSAGNEIIFYYEKTARVTNVKKEAAAYITGTQDYSEITGWQDDTLSVLAGADVIFRVTITGDANATYKLKDIFEGLQYNERTGQLDEEGYAYEYYVILWNDLYQQLGSETGHVINLAWNNPNSGSTSDNPNAPEENEKNDDVTVEVNKIAKYNIYYLPGATNVTNMPSDVSEQEAGDSESVSTKAPSKRGYTFKGWSVDVQDIPTLPGTAFEMPASDVTFTAQWSKNYNPSNPFYFDLTVMYLDEATGDAISDAYKTSLKDGSSYDVTDKTNLEISGYTRSSINGDPVSGTIDEDLLIQVYYRANEVIIEEPEPPLGPAGPDSEPSEPRQELIIIDDSTPLGELPKTGTTSATASPLGPLGAYLVPPSLEGILDLKKEEDDDNQDC